jgi:hypothetical protein
MKQYLILLKSSDFSKNGSTWTSSPINLYANNSYTNFSYKRSGYGLDLIGDTTFVGTEVTSPSSSGEESTPYFTNSVYVTDYGEVVYDSATPSLLRYVDLSSRIDVIAYRHSFTNYLSDSPPNFSIDFYESDTGEITSGYPIDQDPQWMRSLASSEIGTVFIQRSKPYLVVRLDIDPAGSDISSLGLIFYLEVAIHDSSIPILSSSVKSILERFPSWTAIFRDSLNSSTPTLDTPKSVGGRFINSLLQNYLDKINREILLQDINSYLSTADENMIAWVYVSNNVLPNFLKAYGDGIELARVGSYIDFLESRTTDHVFFYDSSQRQLFTIRNYNVLTVDSQIVSQDAVSVTNDFDELGARVALPRLYLESNSNYKKRIQDYSVNRPLNNIESLKKTLRRELDIWRAYGSTPDSNYVGATPEILEMSDIQSSSPYFEASGIPTRLFKSLVENINETYPSNMGYVRWDEGSWDYGGILGEGISRIPAIYDSLSSPLGSYYKPGVGDFDDAELRIDNDKGIFSYADGSSATVSFEGYITIDGTMEATPVSYYPAVQVPYSWYLTYDRQISDADANTAYAEVVYEIDFDSYGSAATPSTFYLNINKDNFSSANLTNYNLSSHSSSPEFSFIKIFDNTGYVNSSYLFRDKIYNEAYIDDSSTPTVNTPHLSDVSNIRIRTGQTWNYDGQSYSSSVTSGEYKVRLTNLMGWANASSSNTFVTSPIEASPSYYNLQLGSNKYNTKTETIKSDLFSSNIYLNNQNNFSQSSTSIYRLDISDLINPIIYPSDATVKNIFLDVQDASGLVSYDGNFNYTRGGIVTADEMDYSSPGVQVLVPSSPNIIYKTYNSSDLEVDSSSVKYFDAATIDYEAGIIDYITIQTADGDLYPFSLRNFASFESSTTPNVFSGYIDRFNNTYTNTELAKHQYFNNDKFLEEHSVSLEDFNLSTDYSYNVERINFNSSNNKVNIYSENIETLINRFNSSFSANQPAVFSIYAEKNVDNSNPYTVIMNPGWIYFDEEEYYIYVNDYTENYNGRFFEINLQNTPKYGVPVLVKVDESYYRNLFFVDSSTPTKHSFYNTEIIRGNYSNALYASYANIRDISIKDLATGAVMFEGLSSLTNEINAFSEATPSIKDRLYEVGYTVNDSFFIDKDVYNESTDLYSSVLHLSTTPSSDVEYAIRYELDDEIGYKPIDLQIDSLDNPLDQGFIYVSSSEYDFKEIDSVLSPNYITDNYNDLMNLTIVSYDLNGNLKPGQTFRIYGNNISATPEYLTTNENGFGKGIVRYSGSIPSTTPIDSFNIEGIGSSTPNGGLNSSSEGYFSQIPFRVVRSSRFGFRIKAVPIRQNVSADGQTDVAIAGQLYWNNIPLQAEIDLTIKVGETLYDTIESSPITSITTSSNGSFFISQVITSNQRTNPGVRFAAIEVEDPMDIESTLVTMGEVLSDSDITIGGEIIYWNEVYDNINYASEAVMVPRGINPSYLEEAQLYSTPAFRYLHSDMSYQIATNSSPNWNPPRWIPIPRYEQYQMGLLGSTPNVVSDYSQMHPDHEED